MGEISKLFLTSLTGVQRYIISIYKIIRVRKIGILTSVVKMCTILFIILLDFGKMGL